MSANTNPFEDDPASSHNGSHNPFDGDSDERKNGHNPFEDDDEKVPVIDKCDFPAGSRQPGSNPFDDGDGSAARSSNPFEQEETSSTLPTNESVDRPIITKTPTAEADDDTTSTTTANPFGDEGTSELTIHNNPQHNGRPSLTTASSTNFDSEQYPVTPEPTSSLLSPLSSTKALTQMLTIAANRSCADCHSTLVDASQVHASLSVHQTPPTSRYNNFTLNHLNFRPPGLTSSAAKNGESLRDPPIDPSLVADAYLGGYGVFVCALCAAAHKLLGPSIAMVHPVHDVTAWTQLQVEHMVSSGGNERATVVLEAYMPTHWQALRPGHGSSIADRLTFCRAKYEALAFCLPPLGPLASGSWTRIVRRHPEWQGLWNADLVNVVDLELANVSPGNSSHGVNGSSAVAVDLSQLQNKSYAQPQLPNRLVDFFCVVTAARRLEPTYKDLSAATSVEEILLAPTISDVYPEPKEYDDTEFPEHISTFCFPDGCHASTVTLAPSFFTIVLTGSAGERMYGGVLRLCDEHEDLDFIRLALKQSKVACPAWLENGQNVPGTASDVVFLPKCLVVISHYPFFDLWRKFLLELYQVTLVKAPLPVERFVANFCREVPLPPPGKIQVKYGITVGRVWTIERPAENQLPMANFSFQPLFASLSVSNVMVLMGCLLQEKRVVLCSKHMALLTPAAEALLSLLFPFYWQGMYVPIMPYRMIDMLDAPVPYLVGLHARYLTETPPQRRPLGVVFCDLDKDTVLLGVDDRDQVTPQLTPALPEKDALKLKTKLDKYAAPAYVMPDSGKVGAITTGLNSRPLTYAERETYAHVTSAQVQPLDVRRKEIFGNIDKAYQDNELLLPFSGFLSEHGQLIENEIVSPSSQHSKSKGKPLLGHRFRKFRRNRMKKGRQSGGGGTPTAQAFSDADSEAMSQASSDMDMQFPDNILDMVESEPFSTAEIRNAFLRFFVSIFRDYRQYLSDGRFEEENFLASLNMPSESREFVKAIVKTQMFHRFAEDRTQSPNDPEILFFDESITAKRNRSKMNALTNLKLKKEETEFLTDTSAVVTETFAPPQPSNWGLPDDGRTYQYGTFPKLDCELFGKTRPPREWPRQLKGRSRRPSVSIATRQNERAILTRAMAPLLETPSMLFNATRGGVKNLNSAISSLSRPFAAPFATRSKRNLGAFSKSLSSDGMSDVTLSTALDPVTSLVSSAEEVVLNARRKQAILMGLMIKTQAVYRGYTARKNYKVLKNELADQREKIVAQEARWGHVVVSIQGWVRGRACRLRFAKKREAIIRIQAASRGRRVRRAYHLLLNAIAKVQATCRGYLARKDLSMLYSSRMKIYRALLPTLWSLAHTPLSYRTKFWPYLKPADVLHLALAEEELQRVLKELGVGVIRNGLTKVDTERDLTVRLGRRLGVSNFIYQRALKVQGCSPSDLVTDSPALASAADRVSAERIQIYERLADDVSADQLEAFFNLFGIPLKDKKKKVALSEAIWVKHESIEASVTCMLQLFTELATSSDIVFQRASKKASRRLSMKSTKTVPDSLPPSMWAHTRLRDRIHKNNNEVSGVLATVARANNGDSTRRNHGEAHDDHQNHVASMRWLFD